METETKEAAIVRLTERDEIPIKAEDLRLCDWCKRWEDKEFSRHMDYGWCCDECYQHIHE